MKLLRDHFKEPNAFVVLVLVERIKVLWVVGSDLNCSPFYWSQLLTFGTQHHVTTNAVTIQLWTVAHLGDKERSLIVVIDKSITGFINDSGISSCAISMEGFYCISGKLVTMVSKKR